MKITGIDTLTANLAPPGQPGGRNFVFVVVHTDEGIDGVGEAYSVGPDEATIAAIADFEQWLIGHDPSDVEFIWQLLYHGSRFPGGFVINTAISGIEQALWDIKGKAAGLPVYQLLGGKCRDRVRVYESARGATPEQMGEHGVELIERYGYTALKMIPQPSNYPSLSHKALMRASAARLEGLRRAVGEDIDIGVDPHSRSFEPVRALQMCEALKPYDPYFFEEPIRQQHYGAMAWLRNRSPVPIATGEAIFTKFEFRELLVKEAVDIIQPDVCMTGGILEMKKIAAMAEAFYVTVAPHNPVGPVATAVNVHFAACTPNFLILEYMPDDRGPRRELVKEPLAVEDGYIPIPDKPGWGVELDLAGIEKHPGRRNRERNWGVRPDGSNPFI
jgi:galactonate dehydratase